MERSSIQVRPCDWGRCYHICLNRWPQTSRFFHSNKCLSSSRCPYLSKCHRSNSFLHRNRCLSCRLSRWINLSHHPRACKAANGLGPCLQNHSHRMDHPQHLAIKICPPNSASKARSHLRCQLFRALHQTCKTDKACSPINLTHHPTFKMLQLV